MGRKRRKTSQNNATKWETALVVPSHHSGRTIEMVGLDSDTGTVFARIASTTDNHSFVELGDVVEAVVGQCSATFAFWKAQSPDAISQELCRLGAIYVLQADTQHPQNPPKWHREHNTHRQIYDKAGTNTIRIHSRPARFPSFSQVTIVTQNDALGFVVLNKPGSCPSHATVDNALENALATVRQSYDYATLPQRLDIETFGLLLVATKPSFATYISRLLEKKTISCTTSTSDIAKDLSNHAITKKYRCLVVLSGQSDYERLQRLHQQPQIVTHYVDANSSAPKRFCEKPPPPTLNNCEKQREKETSTKWQLCQLRLTSVSPLYPVSISGSTLDGESAANASLAVALWGNHQRLPENSKYVVQVEVELLTGRTVSNESTSLWNDQSTTLLYMVLSLFVFDFIN